MIFRLTSANNPYFSNFFSINLIMWEANSPVMTELMQRGWLVVLLALVVCVSSADAVSEGCNGASIMNVVVLATDGAGVDVTFPTCAAAVGYCNDLEYGARVQHACPVTCNTPCPTVLSSSPCTGWLSFLDWSTMAKKFLFFFLFFVSAGVATDVELTAANFSGVATLPSSSAMAAAVNFECTQVPCLIWLFLWQFSPPTQQTNKQTKTPPQLLTLKGFQTNGTLPVDYFAGFAALKTLLLVNLGLQTLSPVVFVALPKLTAL
jgi:hypothetical protein